MDIMTKVRVLWEKVAGITADVSAVDAKATATAATLAGILPRIPKDYSTEEVNTGQKWIDGKDVYIKYLTGSFPTIISSSTQLLGSIGAIDSLIDTDLFIEVSDNHTYKTASTFDCYLTTGQIYAAGVSPSYSEKNFYIIVKYTKPDPVPAQLDNETKKRKTTKKEEK